MKPPPRIEAERWLAQATSDLEFARLGLREGFHAQACFQCQQAAEKALLYILTRYPNGLPGGVPARVFSREQTIEAIAQAQSFLTDAARLIG
jgi:HEPN domain-containing protein